MAKGDKLFVVSVGLKPIGSSNKTAIHISRQSRQLENQLLSFCLVKLNYIRNNIPKERLKQLKAIKDKSLRIKSYKELWLEVGLTEEALDKFQQSIRGNYEHISDLSAICQRLVAKTFDRVFKYAIGKTGRPRFKSSLGNKLLSIEAKELHSAVITSSNRLSVGPATYKLRWDKGNVYHDAAREQIVNYYKLREVMATPDIVKELEESKAKVTSDNETLTKEELGKLVRKARKVIKDRVIAGIGPCAKYSRIVFKRSKRGVFPRLQIVCSGMAPMSHNLKSIHIPKEKNTLDLGPSEVAHVNQSASHASSVNLTSQARVAKQKKIGKLQRSIKRMIKPSKKVKPSNNRTVIVNHLAYLHRCAVEQQRQEHAKLHLGILAGGSLLRWEDHGIKFLQRNRRFSRQISLNQLGKFLSVLKYKAEKAGGYLTEISSRKARLSQSCIFSEEAVKKPLSQRYHLLPNGNKVPRDMYAAWLGNFVDAATGLLDRKGAAAVWVNGVETLLRDAWKLVAAERGKQGLRYLGTIGEPHADRAPISKTSEVVTSCKSIDTVATAGKFQQPAKDLCS